MQTRNSLGIALGMIHINRMWSRAKNRNSWIGREKHACLHTTQYHKHTDRRTEMLVLRETANPIYTITLENRYYF